MMQRERKLFESSTFLINPTRLPRYSKQLKHILEHIEVPRVIETTSREHFIECVRDFCMGPDRYLLVWGGDGTAHDAINAFMNTRSENPFLKRRKSLGFLRGGSGNGIQDSYEVPFGLHRQLAAYGDSIRNNYTIHVDLIRVRQNSSSDYCQLAGVGFDAEVLKRREGRKTAPGQSRSGIVNYLLSFLETFIASKRSYRREYILDLFKGKYAFRGPRVNAEFPISHLVRNISPLMIEAGTRPYYGKFFKVCPDVVCNDGNLDVYVFNFESRLSLVMNGISLWTGRHDRINKRFARKSLPLIEHYEVRKAQISSTLPFGYHLDGELRESEKHSDGGYSLELEIVPQAISFLVPRPFYWKFSPFREEQEAAELADLT